MGFSAGSLATLSLATQAAGGAMSTVGDYYSAKSERSSLQYQARMADLNAELAERNAQSELAKGNQDIATLTMQTGQLKGSQRASLAANGVDLGYGSAAEQLASTDIIKEIDMGILESNALRNAWGYRTAAMNYQNQALMSRATASSISPGMAGFSTLLGSAGKVASSWYQFKKTGAFDKTTPTKSRPQGKSLTKGKTVRKASNTYGYKNSYKLLRA